ncbi:DNA cytosine methyltransferase [Micromonospora zamorensis]|uniref:DNA cytosine methyltransferase n=1 Tax=Micromonospora zamorensis TaxID=709883 RepID=UPI002E28D708|nr:DNA cytosine methyltransferase [Micromonospora zamorensis]
MDASTSLRAIDLFSGPGGLTEGLKTAGFEVIGAVEYEPVAAETYAYNHPDVRLFPLSILDLEPRSVRQELGLQRGELDLLAGCPPCQGFSSLRTRNGSAAANDSRNDLVLQMAIWAKEFLPRAILMENVPALAQDSRMLKLIDELEKLGYPAKSAYRILDAQEYGVPQRRRRLVMMVARGGHIEPKRQVFQPRTVRDAIGSLPEAGRSGDKLHDLPERRTEKVKGIISRIPPDGGSRSDLGEDQLACHKRVSGFHDIYGRMAWDKPSPTITSGCSNPSKGRFLHPVENRAITLREAALLQTFPERYWFSLKRGKEAAALMIGNALPPRFVAAHGETIRHHLLCTSELSPASSSTSCENS